MNQGFWLSGALAASLLFCGCATSQSNSESSASSGSSGADSTGASIANSLDSKYPTSVQSTEPSRDSSAQSSESSLESSNASGDSTGNSSDSSKTQSAFAPVLSTVGLSTTVGGLGALIWLTAQPSPREAKAAQAFFRANRFQLEEDLALGAGRSIEDLAALARIRRENLPAFCRLLHLHREQLLELADADTLTPERAVRALRLVGELASTEPALAADGREAMAVLEPGAQQPE